MLLPGGVVPPNAVSLLEISLLELGEELVGDVFLGPKAVEPDQEGGQESKEYGDTNLNVSPADFRRIIFRGVH